MDHLPNIYIYIYMQAGLKLCGLKQPNIIGVYDPQQIYLLNILKFNVVSTRNVNEYAKD